MQRSILVFLEIADMERIERLRAQYDPLYGLVAPHLTLVFPFESDRSAEELLAHTRHAVQGIAPFEVTLHGLIPSGDEYLFLAVRRGHDGLVALHDRLYTGILREFLHPDIPYRPHLTVGRFPDRGRLEKAVHDAERFVDTFTTIVDRVSLETIGDDGRSQIEGTIRLEYSADAFFQ